MSKKTQLCRDEAFTRWMEEVTHLLTCPGVNEPQHRRALKEAFDESGEDWEEE